MKISVRPRDIEWSDELQKQVERSIAYAVDRYSTRVTHISVYLADLNGPRGGVDKLCQITADMRGTMPVLILEKGDDLLATVNRAARRLGYRIGRRIQQVRTRTRTPRTPARRPEIGSRAVVVSWPALKRSA
jgi:ribosome-associated translation inhibitor RaiA